MKTNEFNQSTLPVKITLYFKSEREARILVGSDKPLELDEYDNPIVTKGITAELVNRILSDNIEELSVTYEAYDSLITIGYLGNEIVEVIVTANLDNKPFEYIVDGEGIGIEKGKCSLVNTLSIIDHFKLIQDNVVLHRSRTKLF